MKKHLLKKTKALNVSGVRAELISENENKIRKLAVACAIMFSWILIWALVLKLGSETLIVRNYNNLKDMTFKERILWDLIPFNDRGEDYLKLRLMIETGLNAFVFAPFAITLCYIFKNENVFRDAAICLAFSLMVETTQLLTILGNPATEDLITNTTGAFVGYAIYCLILKRLSIRKSVILWSAITVMVTVVFAFSLITTAMVSETIIKIITRTL